MFGDIMIAILIRTTILYLTVTLCIRLMGKRQIGDMQPNELVVTLLISEIAAIPLQDSDQPVLYGITAIFILVFLEILSSVLSMKSFFIRKILNGSSIVIIKNGTIDQKAMKQLRITVLDLVEMLRVQDVFDVNEVAFAVIEVNGNLSVLLKKEEQAVKIKDIEENNSSVTMPLPVICDGIIIKESLASLDISKNKFLKILKSQNINSKNIFLMTMDKKQEYNIIKKD